MDENGDLQELPSGTDLDIIPYNPAILNEGESITQYPWFWEQPDGEITTDCPYSIQWMGYAWILGDANYDGSVDVMDLLEMAYAFGTVADGSTALAACTTTTFFGTDMPALQDCTTYFDPGADVNHDRSVDVVDLLILAYAFGENSSSQPAWPTSQE